MNSRGEIRAGVLGNTDEIMSRPEMYKRIAKYYRRALAKTTEKQQFVNGQLLEAMRQSMATADRVNELLDNAHTKLISKELALCEARDLLKKSKKIGFVWFCFAMANAACNMAYFIYKYVSK